VNITELFGTFRDDAGHWHPIAFMTIRCFKMADGSPGTEIVDGVELVKPGIHCGLMLGHQCACDFVHYDMDWHAEAIT
jgi:hypothetical protein